MNPQNDDTTSDGFKEFEELKNKFEEEIKQRLIQCEKNENSGKLIVDDTNNVTLCSGCCLEFFYYYDSIIPPSSRDGYKNAIWIKVHNIHGLNIWIRVHNNKNGKKINVFSDRQTLGLVPNIPCLVLTNIKAYGLPKQFLPSCYMSHKGRVVNRKLSWENIIDEICNILPCLCNTIL
jgi:hypothetical protein